MWLCTWQGTKSHPANSTVAQFANCKIMTVLAQMCGGSLKYLLHLITDPVE